MPNFRLFIGSLQNNREIFSGKAACQSYASHDCLSLHPDTVVETIEEVKEEPGKSCKCKKGLTRRQWRNHHKARITQMRNNAISLIDDEDAVITDSERLQLSRIACQLDRILALWPTRQYELNLENHK